MSEHTEPVRQGRQPESTPGRMRRAFDGQLTGRNQWTSASSQRGYVLITVVLLLALVSVIAFLNNRGTASHVEEVSRANDADQALSLARAGIARAIWEVEASDCLGTSTVPPQPMNGGTYAATANASTANVTYRVDVSQDTWLDESAPATNFGGDIELRVNNQPGGSRRALYRFDVSSIPAGSHVQSATAWFLVKNKDQKGVIGLHRVNQAWLEFTATWATSGSAFEAMPDGSIPVQDSNDVWVDVNLTPLVQGWVNGSVPNYGVMLVATSDSTESRYTSREWSTATERPRLQVVVGTATTTRIQATGTSSAGAESTLVRDAEPMFQSPLTAVLQPDADHGQDGWITSTQTSWNYGSHANLNVNSGTQRSLLRFDLGALPVGLRVDSARLGLYTPGSVSTGSVGVFGVTRAWQEGSCSGTGGCAADGATWATYDGTSNWTSSGGDFEGTPADNRAILSSAGWMEWDVTDLVDQWLSGKRPNYGVLLKAASGSVSFFSSDNADAAKHPKLVISLRCRCGEACAVPKGHGNLLLIVRDATSLTGDEKTIRDAINSWGYLVTPLNYNASQSAFQSAVNSSDVVYVPAETPEDLVDTLLGFNLGNRARSIAKGVVLAQGRFNDEIGFSAGTQTPVGTAINVTDTSHYITWPFPVGPLAIKTGATRLTSTSGTTASGLQTLADINGAAGVAVLDVGAALYGGGAAPARRVMLPLGDTQSSNWNQLNNNGRLLVQRALQWAIGDSAGSAETPMKIFWTDDQGNKIQRADGNGANVTDVLTGLNQPTGLDIDTVNGKIYWANNLQIKRANLDGSNIETLVNGMQKTFDIKLDVDNNKMYWTHDNGYSAVKRANLDGSSVQTISTLASSAAYITLDKTAGRLYLTDFGSGRISRMNLDGSGFTTMISGQGSPIGNGLDLNAGKVYWTDGATGDKLHRANLDGSGKEVLVTGLNAPQDVAIDTTNGKVYWVDALTAPAVKRAKLDGSDAQTLVTGLVRPRGIIVVSDAALAGAGGGGGGSGGGSGGTGGTGGATSCSGNYRDEFKQQVYSGSDGSLTWSGDWQEINESDGPASGDVRVFADMYEYPPMPTYQIHVRSHSGTSGKGMMRALDLNGARTAVLSFDYKPAGLDNSADYVAVEMSSNGAGGPWTEIVRFAGPANETAYRSFSQDVSAFASANTVLRFLGSAGLGSSDYLFFDNIQVTCAP